MRPSFRALFLILAASFVLHVSLMTAIIVLVGYFTFERLDQYLATSMREKKFDEINFGWEPNLRFGHHLQVPRESNGFWFMFGATLEQAKNGPKLVSATAATT